MKLISAAFVKAQKGFSPALKSSTNPHFKSRYADLSACVEAVIDSLNANGIALTQSTALDETGVTVETVFIHESGERMSCGPLHVPASKQDAQGYCSALTYARRYSLMAACCIAPEDDDGNAAAKKHEPIMPRPVFDDHITAIGRAMKIPDLQAVYAAAYAAAKKAEDMAAMKQITAAKDTRKKFLQDLALEVQP